MQALLLPIGFAIIGLAAADLIKTTLGMRGGGYYSAPFVDRVWRLLLRVHGRRKSHHLLATAGPLLLVTLLLLWVVPLWLGTTLVFCAADGAVAHSAAHADLPPVGFWERAYFAGFTLITLGVGDYVPGGDGWRVLTVLASGTGFFFVTLIITYFLPLVSAVVQKRTLALRITSLGRTPREMLERSWDGRSFSPLEKVLPDLAEGVAHLSQSHLAYPFLHHYHSAERAHAIAPSIAALDEALTILMCAADERLRPSAAVLQSAHRTLGAFLETLDLFVHHADEPPPTPDVRLPHADGARDAEWPALSSERQEAFRCRLEDMSLRRRRVLGYVRQDGWEWDDVVSDAPMEAPAASERKAHQSDNQRTDARPAPSGA